MHTPPTPSFSYYGLDCFEHIYVWKEKGSILLEELDLLGHMVVLYLSSWEPDRLCSTLGLHFHFLWQCVEGSLVSTSFQACVTVFLVCCSRSSEYEITLVTVLICVFLVVNDTEQLLLQSLPILIPTLVECLHILVHSVFAVFLHRNYVSDMCHVSVLSQSVRLLCFMVS